MPPTASPPSRYPKADTATLKKFGDNVRARRESQDLSQEQLAERADIDRTHGHSDSNYTLPE